MIFDMERKVLVSTDIGSDIDDALSILTMFNMGLNVRGIYTVNGDVDSRSYIAKHMVDLYGTGIPVGRGTAESLSGEKPYSFCEDAYVDDKFVKFALF